MAIDESQDDAIQWNIKQVNAQIVWNRPDSRSKGQGVIYAIADTGVQYSHPVLKNSYLGLKSDGQYNHNYAWYDGVRAPVAGAVKSSCGYASRVACDDQGHGTHTLGTAIGINGYGVAPGAKWMACRNMESGVGSPETYLNCLNFFLAPHDLDGRNPNPSLRPHVIGNSYGCPDSEGCSIHALTAAVEALRSAGIFMSVSAGNEGPNCSTIGDPPAVEKASIVVAAVDKNDFLAGFSSRGPVLIDGTSLRKPDLSAPGVGVNSAYPGNSYKRMSGTSMASPHVSGAAILLSKSISSSFSLCDLFSHHFSCF